MHQSAEGVAVAFSESLDVFLSDFGVAVTNGITTATGVLDMPSEIIAGGMVVATDYALTLKASDFPALAYPDPLTVNGAAYTVREVRAQDDGVFVIVYLSKT